MGVDTEMLTKMFESAGEGPGIWDKMKEFATKNHQLLAQLFSGAGADINATGSLGKNFNDTIVGNIGSQNIIKVLQGMLGGKVAPGGGIKITDKGVQANLPMITPVGQPGPNPGDNALDTDWLSKLYQESLSGKQGASPTASVVPGTGKDPGTGQNTPLSNDFQLGSTPQIGAVLNPFAPGQLNLSANDLAGLNPNQILAVAELKGRQDAEETSRFNSNVDAEYKLDIMRKYYNGELSAKAAQQQLDDYQNKTQRMNAITAAYNAGKGTDTVQNYEYAKTPEGGNFTGTMAEFKAYGESGDWGNYQKAITDPINPYKGNFESWIKKYGNKGVSVTNVYENTKQRNKANQEDLGTDPDLPQKVLEEINKTGTLKVKISEAETFLGTQGLTPPDRKASKDEFDAWNKKIAVAKEILKRKKHIAALGAKIRQANRGKTVVYKEGIGWIIGKEIIQRDPYAK
jgi:hypothetical protein